MTSVLCCREQASETKAKKNGCKYEPRSLGILFDQNGGGAGQDNGILVVEFF